MPRLLQSENEAHQLLGYVGDRNIVMLSFCPFLGKVGGKGGVPQTDILGGVVNGIAQVSRASFFHVRIAILELSGLVGRGRESGIGKQLVGRSKA